MADSLELEIGGQRIDLEPTWKAVELIDKHVCCPMQMAMHAAETKDPLTIAASFSIICYAAEGNGFELTKEQIWEHFRELHVEYATIEATKLAGEIIAQIVNPTRQKDAKKADTSAGK